jgi:thioredoxin 1
MKSAFAYFLCAIATAVFFSGCAGNIPPPEAKAPGLPEGVVMLDKKNFSGMIAVPSRVSVVDFFHPGCPPCMKMESIVQRLGVRFKGRALIGKVNVDTDDSLINAFPVIPTPTFLFFNRGRLSESIRGIFKEDSLAAMIDSLIAGNFH